MTPAEFTARWQAMVLRDGLTAAQDPLVRLPVSDSRLRSVSDRFLTEAGLPGSASPSMQFGDLADGLKRIYEVYAPQSDWPEEAQARLRALLMIGDDAGGNPICIDTDQQDAVVWVSQETFFQAIRFMNSGVAQLAGCLLALRVWIGHYQDVYGPETELWEQKVPQEIAAQAISQMRAVDPAAFRDENNFWPQVLKGL